MSNALARIVNLKIAIMNGKISLKEVKSEICKIEEEFGDEAFLPFTVEKKKKPWSKKYLKELEELNIAGAGSKEFILHFAEVKDYIKRTKRLIIGLVGVGIIVIAGIVLWLCKR